VVYTWWRARLADSPEEGSGTRSSHRTRRRVKLGVAADAAFEAAEDARAGAAGLCGRAACRWQGYLFVVEPGLFRLADLAERMRAGRITEGG
jgi:hypothetical protein